MEGIGQLDQGMCTDKGRRNGNGVGQKGSMERVIGWGGYTEY
jgi:hypothetical protein